MGDPESSTLTDGPGRERRTRRAVLRGESGVCAGSERRGFFALGVAMGEGERLSGVFEEGMGQT
jgi:hypothetical protein